MSLDTKTALIFETVLVVGFDPGSACGGGLREGRRWLGKGNSRRGLPMRLPKPLNLGGMPRLNSQNQIGDHSRAAHVRNTQPRKWHLLMCSLFYLLGHANYVNI